MSLTIVHNDITMMHTDAIVNTANPHPIVGAGTDTAVHSAAGPELLEARKRIGDIPRGEARVTPGYRLPAKYVIHAVSAMWNEQDPEGSAALLRRTYDSALAAAVEYGCASVAFPLMASGTYGYPQKLALEIANEAFAAFLCTHELDITLVLFDKQAVNPIPDLQRQVRRAILEEVRAERDIYKSRSVSEERNISVLDEVCFSTSAVHPDIDPEEMHAAKKSRLSGKAAPAAKPDLYTAEEKKQKKAMTQKAKAGRNPLRSAELSEQRALPNAMPQDIRSDSARSFADMSLEETLTTLDESFAEMVFRKIREQQLTNVECYTRSNLTKAAFSKIKKAYDDRKSYTPKRETAFALAVGLRLDAAETRELLSKAGFYVSRSIPLDVAVMYFISHRNYNILEINCQLYELDLPLLGQSAA